MKINKLKINGFGKVKNKELELKNGINLIYGKNESGKSTILKFILNSFYGTSKNKKGRDISDYEQNKPWNSEEFSGKLEYCLDNGETYEIYREFAKKNPKIFNEQAKDIAKEFSVDKTKGNEFFYEQTKVDENLFLASCAMLQQEVKIAKSMQNIFLQKMANRIGTGEDNVSYQKAIEKINKRQLEQIGTKKSREKPINIIEQKLDQLVAEKMELEKCEKKRSELEDLFQQEEQEKKRANLKKELVKEIKKIKETKSIEQEKIKIQENISQNQLEKINEIEKKIKEIEKENKDLLEEKKSNKKEENKNKLKKNSFYFIFITLTILCLLFIGISNFVVRSFILQIISFATVPIIFIFYLFFKSKIKKEEINQLNENSKSNKIKKEIELLEQEKNILEINQKETKKEIQEIEKKNLFRINLEKERIKNKYSAQIRKEEINQLIDTNQIEEAMEFYQEKVDEIRIKQNRLDIEKENNEKKLERLSNIEEEIATLSQEYVNLEKINESMEFAKKILEQSYSKMRNTVTPKFVKDLSTYISNITEGKYTNVVLQEENGLMVELENGDYIPADRLSVGTIDQLYLSLRFAMIEEISEEQLPLLLDEVFAYFDETRLSNLLRYMNSQFNNKQIILFTCTKRERDILEKEKIPYQWIEL